MTVPARYEAFWVPGLNHDIDPDESLSVVLQWLTEAEQRHQAAGVIVMYAKSMAGNRPLLTWAAQPWEFVSPRSRQRPFGAGPVLAIWPPDAEVLELAERLALDSALCVIAGYYDVSPWVKKAQATCLIEGYEAELTETDLVPEVNRTLDAMLAFDGHNGFIGAGGKEDAIRGLQTIAGQAHPPTPEAIESYLAASGETNAKGASRARRWYEEILEGKRHRDQAGRII
jgi:hypothetical protein